MRLTRIIASTDTSPYLDCKTHAGQEIERLRQLVRDLRAALLAGVVTAEIEALVAKSKEVVP